MPNLPNAPRKFCFVFGSNEGGIHGAGAAKVALNEYGAQWGKSYGHYGSSFAIPTKDEYIVTLPLDRIKPYVDGFLAYARAKNKTNFKITQVGCGLAGIPAWKMAALFHGSSENCWFDTAWRNYLPTNTNFWGTFP